MRVSTVSTSGQYSTSGRGERHGICPGNDKDSIRKSDTLVTNALSLTQKPFTYYRPMFKCAVGKDTYQV